MGVEEYRAATNGMKLKNEELVDMFRGKNNPAYKHGGKYSPWSSNSIVHSKETISESKQKAISNNPILNDKSRNAFCREYYGSDADYKMAQTKNLSWFIAKYGEEGIKRHANKTRKWINSFKRLSYSKISQELFHKIMEIYDSDSVFYATYNRPEMEKYKNKEFRLMVEGRGILPDFVDITNKKVIEFDGDYWHSANRVNPKREAERELLLKKAGFSVLRIKEQDFKKDRNGVVDQCINFLTS